MILNVSVEFEGTFQQVGRVATRQAVGGVFQYDDSWIAKHPDLPLSISLPVSNNEFNERQIKPYFAGLLPEGQALVEVANRFDVSTASYLKILRALGDECIGAVRIADAEISKGCDEPHYEKLSEAEIDRISVASYPKSAQVNADAKLSIAGAQTKLVSTLTLLRKNFSYQRTLPPQIGSQSLQAFALRT